MRERALVHVAGPKGAGKTALIEALLEAEIALAICVRAERDPRLRGERESAPRAHAELRRYRAAGASAVALYRFAEPNNDAFFTSAVMQHYSEAVLIEGDCPVEHVDLRVFVSPPLPGGASLLRRVLRDHAPPHRAGLAMWAKALESDQGLAALLGGAMGEPLMAEALRDARALSKVRQQRADKLEKLRSTPPPDAPLVKAAQPEGGRHWLSEGGRGRPLTRSMGRCRSPPCSPSPSARRSSSSSTTCCSPSWTASAACLATASSRRRCASTARTSRSRRRSTR